MLCIFHSFQMIQIEHDSDSTSTGGGQIPAVKRMRCGNTLRSFLSTNYFEELFSKSGPHNTV